MIDIRQMRTVDAEPVWQLFRTVVQEGNAFLSDESVSRDDVLKLWLGDNVKSYVAIDKSDVIGAYNLKANHHGCGNHVANSSYMVDSSYRGRGVGRLLAEHSLRTAKEMGYVAMQFNAVVSTNVAAIRLWKQIGFSIVGTIPNGFHDPTVGFVDMYVMHKVL